MSLWRRWRSNAVAVTVGGDRGLGGQSAADREIPPAVEHGHLVGARVAHPELGHLRAFPVALPVEVALEAGELLEAVAIGALAFRAASRASPRKPVAYQGMTTVPGLWLTSAIIHAPGVDASATP